MVAHDQATDHLRARAEVNMPADSWQAIVSTTNRHLLKDQAVRADARAGVDHDAIRVRQRKAATELAIQGNVCAGHRAPNAARGTSLRRES